MPASVHCLPARTIPKVPDHHSHGECTFVTRHCSNAYACFPISGSPRPLSSWWLMHFLKEHCACCFCWFVVQEVQGH